MAEPLSYKVVVGIAFKAVGDVFHEFMLRTPHDLADISPHRLHGCLLHEGDYGTPGAKIEWQYTLEGKQESVKQVITEVDEERRHIVYKNLEGDMMENYKEMVITVDVETQGGVDFISWTLEYELVSPEKPHPFPLATYFINWTKEIEAHLLE